MTEKQRLWSIDALRGADMFFIMGGTLMILRLCVALAGGDAGWHWPLAEQLYHCEWDGLRFYDCLFPLFLFLAGASWPFSLASQRKGGVSEGRIALRCIRRGLTLLLFGLILNGLFKFTWNQLFFGSVLGRIGCAWMFAALASLVLKVRGRIVLTAAILVGYWMLVAFVPAPDAPIGARPFSNAGNIVGWVDRFLWPNHIGKCVTVAEGFLNTVPAVGTALLGIFAGEIVRRDDIAGNHRVLWLIASAIGLTSLTWLISRAFGTYSMPINKCLWSSSYVCATGAFSFAMLALFYWMIDVRGWRRWTFFFRVIGMNAITIYMLRPIVDINKTVTFFLGGIMSCCPEIWADFILSCGYVT
ncbi:MAG: DUF5009 domain-containing protein, partial [Kiritimatiellae bacterium]|nr:DUF5009 domain-containing protein [Kiritimatiellia bacterium]